jgi:NAD(P)-dependent dehydrogenase (short-subunit alcohol dehydrogenase family)
MRLARKAAIVTGGGAGIGEAIAHKFAREGASVLVADLPDSAAQEVVDSIVSTGGRAGCYLGDLSREEDAIACVQAALDAFGHLDVLASNAGVFVRIGEVDLWDADTFDFMMRSNTRSTFLMTKYAVRQLQKTRGNIVFTGSITAIMGAAELSVYGASKGFVHAFMMGIALEQAKYGVRANAVAPGAIATSWTTAGSGGPIDVELQRQTADGAAMGRQGTPEEMANVVAFLASDEASYVTGAVVVADGGVVPAQGAPGAQVPAGLKQPPENTLPLRHSFNGEKGKPVVRSP